MQDSLVLVMAVVLLQCLSTVSAQTNLNGFLIPVIMDSTDPVITIMDLKLDLNGCAANCSALPSCIGFTFMGPDASAGKCLLRASMVNPKAAETGQYVYSYIKSSVVGSVNGYKRVAG